MKLTIAVDFDGTICNDEFPFCGDPKDGVAKSLRQLQDKYCILIYSARNNLTQENRDLYLSEMVAFLKEHDIPFDTVDMGLEGKPLVDAFIDDRAIPFEDNWDELTTLLMRD